MTRLRLEALTPVRRSPLQCTYMFQAGLGTPRERVTPSGDHCDPESFMGN
jgi:hypothetical protein